MQLSLKVAGADRNVTQPYLNVGGTWRSVSGGWLNVGGTWRQFYSATPGLSVGVTNTVALGSGNGSGPFDTYGVQAQPSGGSGSFTFHWESIGGDAMTNGFPDGWQDAYWTASGTPGTSKVSYWRCRVIDNVTGVVAYSPTVTVTITFNLPTLSAGVSNTNAYGSATNYFPYTFTQATTTTITAIASGGSGSYSFAWEWVSGDVIGPNSASSASTNWTAGSNFPATFSGAYRCKITDLGTGAIAYTPNVGVNLNIDSNL